CKRASSQKRRAHRFEITGQNDLQIRSLKLARIVLRFGSAPTHRTKPARERQRIRRCHTVHTRKRVELLAKLALERLSFLRRGAGVTEQLKRQQPTRIKPEIHTLNIKERAKHQA